MKKVIIAALIAVGASIGAFAQGTVQLDNQFNTNATIGAASSGYVYFNGALATGPFNVTLMGGSTSSNMTSIATLLYSTGGILSGSDIGAPGQWIDVTGSTYTIPGVAAQGTAVLDLLFWAGNGTFATYAAAFSGGGQVATTGNFSTVTGGNGVAGTEMIGMPSVNMIVQSPEPATLAICGLGAASLLLFRRRK